MSKQNKLGLMISVIKPTNENQDLHSTPTLEETLNAIIDKTKDADAIDASKVETSVKKFKDIKAKEENPTNARVVRITNLCRINLKTYLSNKDEFVSMADYISALIEADLKSKGAWKKTN